MTSNFQNTAYTDNSAIFNSASIPDMRGVDGGGNFSTMLANAPSAEGGMGGSANLVIGGVNLVPIGKQTNARNTFRDWDAAEAEKRDQQLQQQRPMNPPQNNPGPVNTTKPQSVNNDEEENWEEYLNRPNNNNF